jgi:hypothetical protein
VTVGLHISGACTDPSLFPLKLATLECYCDPSDSRYYYMTCGASTSFKTDHASDDTCLASAGSTLVLADACEYRTNIGGFNIYASLFTCIINGSASIPTQPPTTFSPTTTPTTGAPTTGYPTNSPTATASPTQSPIPTTAQPTLPPAPQGTSRYVLADDWIGSYSSPRVLPWPIDECILSYPDLRAFGNAFPLERMFVTAVHLIIKH